MTDHDALARRIAEDIMTACRGGPEERAIRLDLIGLDGRRLGAWAIDALARRIAEHLREALPTSEAKSKILTPEQTEIARSLVSMPSVVWSDRALTQAHNLLRELLS